MSEDNERLKAFLKMATIVSDEECKKMLEAGTLAVCMRVSMGGADVFPDNQFGECGVCGCAIYFRPYTAPAVNKVCMQCCFKLGKAEV